MTVNTFEFVMIFFCRLALSLGGQAGHHVHMIFVASKEIQIHPSKEIQILPSREVTIQILPRKEVTFQIPLRKEVTLANTKV